MTTEQSFFMQVLQDHFHKRSSVCPEGLDWQAMQYLANIQQLEGIVFSQCKHVLNSRKGIEDYWSEFEKAEMACLFCYVNRREVLKKLQEAFTKAEIPYIIVKGPEVAKFYPSPALRSMGDVDLVVHPEDRERAHEIFLSLGCSSSKVSEEESIYKFQQFSIELHTALLYDLWLHTPELMEYTGRLWEYAHPVDNTMQYRLEWHFHYIFLLLHLRKHLVSTGCGIRQFLDLAVVAKYADMDFEKLEQDLKQLGFLQLHRAALGLCSRWLDLEFPCEVAELDDTFVETATLQLLDFGIFGASKTDAIGNEVYASLSDDTSHSFLLKLKLFQRMVFPSYSYLREWEEYSFLNGRPYLLPVAWVVRGFRYLFCKKNKHGMVKDALQTNSGELARKADFLNQLGLQIPGKKSDL